MKIQKTFLIVEEIISFLIVCYVAYEIRGIHNDLIKVGLIYIFIRTRMFYKPNIKN